MTRYYSLRLDNAKAVVTAAQAHHLAYVCRHLRVGRVRRVGRRGMRGYIIKPRNRAEWPLGKGLLRGHH